MQPKQIGKYELREIHQEIDLFDRKIAYCRSFEKFESEEARTSALQKLETKRQTLAKRAMEAAGRGVEFDAKDLPRSFREKEASESAS